MGFQSVTSNGPSAPPYFLAFLCAVLMAFLGDRTKQRALLVCFSTLVGSVGYTVLCKSNTLGVRYFAVFLISAVPNTVSWNLSRWPPQLNTSNTHHPPGPPRVSKHHHLTEHPKQTTRAPRPASRPDWPCSRSSDSSGPSSARACILPRKRPGTPRGWVFVRARCSSRPSLRLGCGRCSGGRTGSWTRSTPLGMTTRRMRTPVRRPRDPSSALLYKTGRGAYLEAGP